jgi:hypothetical protein
VIGHEDSSGALENGRHCPNGPDQQKYPGDVVYPGASMRDIARFQSERADFSRDDHDNATEYQMHLLKNPEGARYERLAISGRYIEINFSPLDDGSKLIVHRDITELKHREEALELCYARLL